MRMTLYYFTRTFKNQVRKLLHTWVAIFLVACLLFGGLIGVGVGVLGSMFEEKEEDNSPEYEEVLPSEGEEMFELDEQTRNGLFELATGGIVLLMLVFAVLGADKNGGAIFLPADVSLLFPAPLKPQTVLLFRLIMQMGGTLLATLYLLFQIPAMVISAGLGGLTVFAILCAWVLLLIFSRLVSVLLYTVTTTHLQWKRYLRVGVLGSLFALAAAFLGFSAKTPAGYLDDALTFFNAPATRYIPLWGWIKAMVIFSLEGRVLPVLLCIAALLALCVLVCFIIWHLRADFYEDAMARSEETAAAQAQIQSGGKEIKQRKKERSDKLRRSGLSHGAGASVYFFKTMYNRFRFAYLRIFTKTALTYLVIGGGAALLMCSSKITVFFPLIPMLLCAMAFFRSLGNPIATDVEKESFALVPDSAHKKVLFSFLGGVTCSALDLAPAFIFSAIVLLPNPAEVIVWFALSVSIGAYADATGMFIDLSLPTGISATARSLVQILFIYFGLIPAVLLIAIGFLLDLPLLFAALVILFDLAIAALSLLISPLFIERGRK